jgi:hypothetical protein
MRVVLAMLYRNFDVTPAPGATRVRELFAFAMAPNAVRVMPSPRARA